MSVGRRLPAAGNRGTGKVSGAEHWSGAGGDAAGPGRQLWHGAGAL